MMLWAFEKKNEIPLEMYTYMYKCFSIYAYTSLRVFVITMHEPIMEREVFWTFLFIVIVKELRPLHGVSIRSKINRRGAVPHPLFIRYRKIIIAPRLGCYRFNRLNYYYDHDVILVLDNISIINYSAFVLRLYECMMYYLFLYVLFDCFISA